MLNDPVTAQYTHTPTMTTAGEYTCTVSNNKPSIASARIFVAGIIMHFYGELPQCLCKRWLL